MGSRRDEKKAAKEARREEKAARWQRLADQTSPRQAMLGIDGRDNYWGRLRQAQREADTATLLAELVVAQQEANRLLRKIAGEQPADIDEMPPPAG